MSDFGNWLWEKTKEVAKDLLGSEDEGEGESIRSAASEAWTGQSKGDYTGKALRAPRESETVDVDERALPTEADRRTAVFDQLTPETAQGSIELKFDRNGHLGLYCENNKLFLMLPKELADLAKQFGLNIDKETTAEGVRVIAKIPEREGAARPLKESAPRGSERDREPLGFENPKQVVKKGPPDTSPIEASTWTPITDRRKVFELLKGAGALPGQGKESTSGFEEEIKGRVAKQREAQRSAREGARAPERPGTATERPGLDDDYERDVRERALKSRAEQQAASERAEHPREKEKPQDGPKTREQLLLEEKAKAPDAGNVRFTMLDGGSVEIKFPGKKEIAEMPVADLQKMFSHNQTALKRVMAEFQAKLPVLGFHGTSAEGAEGLQSSRANATSGFDVWTYKKDPSSMLSDMAAAAHKAKSIYADRIWSSGDERPGPIVVVKLDSSEVPKTAAHSQHKISNQWQMSRNLNEQSIELNQSNFSNKVLGIIPRSAFDGLGYPFEARDMFKMPRPDDAARQEIAIALQAQKIAAEALKLAANHTPVKEIKPPQVEKRKISVMRR